MNYKDKKVVIMGLGVAGGAVNDAIYFARKGADILVTDIKSELELSSSIELLKDYSVKYTLGQHKHEDFEQADLIVRNPFVRSDSPFLETARKNSIPIEMSVSLFMKHSPTKNIIGVTGTRGKSTTSAMIYEALKASGKDVFFGGNVKGISTVSLLDKVSKDSWVVLELSSWQLQSFGWYGLSPHIAVMTNIYEDHLNYYNSMKEYVEDKEHIFLHQKKNDIVLFNRNNSYTKAMYEKTSSQRSWFVPSDWPEDKKLTIAGSHNIENASVALNVCELIGLKRNQSILAIQQFKGLPGRLEFIREVDGITYINDTTSTTPISGIKAIEAFPKNHVVLITGGNSKKISIGDFVDVINKRVKFTVLFDGTAVKEFEGIVNVSDPIDILNMKKAMKIAVSKAKAGDIVVFSPATTHLPIINEFKRGDEFARQVKAL